MYQVTETQIGWFYYPSTLLGKNVPIRTRLAFAPYMGMLEAPTGLYLPKLTPIQPLRAILIANGETRRLTKKYMPVTPIALAQLQADSGITSLLDGCTWYLYGWVQEREYKCI